MNDFEFTKISEAYNKTVKHIRLLKISTVVLLILLISNSIFGFITYRQLRNEISANQTEHDRLAQTLKKNKSAISDLEYRNFDLESQLEDSR